MSQSEDWESDDDFAQDDDGVTPCGGGEARDYKFKTMNYIPFKYRTKYLWCIAFNIFVLIVIVTVLVLVSSGNNTDVTSKVNIRHKLYFIINSTKVVHYDLDYLSSQFEASKNSTFLSYEFDGSINRYWIEKLNDSSCIVAQINDGHKILLHDKSFKPNALVYDSTSRNLYATDDNAGLLIAMNLDSGYFFILLADIIRPRDILLDSNEGFVFVLQHLHSIVRANMDGSAPTEIVDETGITAFSIDPISKRLYWINDYLTIESSDYEGKNRRFFFTSSTKIATLTIADKELFWVESKQHDNINTVYSCKIVADDHCEHGAIRKFDIVGNATSIRSYISANRTVTNPCQSNNGGCEHLCLLSGRNKRRCACRMGWQLNPDNRTCEEVRDFVLYPYNGVVRTCTLDGRQELFWPTPYSVNKLTVKTEIDFDYDLKNDYFYFTDDHHIHRMKLKSYTGQQVILSVDSSDTIIEDIAFDWSTGNMFFGQRHVNASFDHSLVVFNTRLGKSYRKSIKIFDQDDMKARSCALALHPAKGYLFVSAAHESAGDTHVFRTKVNGINYTRTYHFKVEGVSDHRFLTIDYKTDRVYLIEEIGKNIGIAYTQIEVLGLKYLIHRPDFSHARTIAVHDKWLYLSNYSSIWRFDKDTGRNGLSIAPRIADPAKKIIGVRIISKEVQLAGHNNPCAKNNGGCEQLCFSGSNAICDCKDGQEVIGDGSCHVVD